MSARLAAAIVTTCLCSSLRAQTPAPDLTRQQRELLQAIVTAVDAAAAQPETAGLAWQQHIMRASDGSHYLAFSAEPPASAALPSGPAVLYVRLATAAPPGAQRLAERSQVKEWLAGSRTDPRLLPRRGIAMGEMPVMGPTGNFGVRQPVTTGSNELRLMQLERERAKQEKDERDKQRRAELEGMAAANRDHLPFEDFDLASRSVNPAGARILTRAFTAGPGDYDLYLAWADPSAPKPHATIRVLRKAISLEPARTTGLITSSVILADSVTTRPQPYSPAEQGSHPYSIGAMEIVPARSSRYAPGDNLSVAFQVINAQSDDAGTPNVAVNFHIVKVTGERESQVASLTPQTYNAATLPADFNLRLGHPIFAAVSAPLATLGRGDYRLKIAVHDRIANTVANTEAAFSVIATPASLLAEAPPPGLPFRRESVINAETLPGILASLRPPSLSPALQRAFDLAAAGRFVDLMVEEPVAANEEGVRAALRGLAQMSVGDGSAAVQFQRAQLLGAPIAVTRLLSGAARAMQSRDADAIAAWQEAIKAGAPMATVAPHLLDAYLRRNDIPRATQVVAELKIPRGAWSRATAAVMLATQRENEAIPMLEGRLASAPGDTDAQWLLLQALFSQVARNAPGAPAARDRFAALARVYIDANGPHAGLAEEWLAGIR